MLGIILSYMAVTSITFIGHVQVGMSISPLSNNFLFRKIATNPFPKLFKRGLNVTLSTDDPLLFHMSDDALLEGNPIVTYISNAFRLYNFFHII